MSYRPLQRCLRIDSSDIDGQGLFANEPLISGTNLGLGWRIVDGEKIRHPTGGFVNHSDDPNCRTEEQEIRDQTYIYLITTQDIEKDEELTLRYRDYVPNNSRDREST